MLLLNTILAQFVQCFYPTQPAFTCSELTIKSPERCHWRRSGVFVVNFEHSSRLFLVFLLLTLKNQMLSGYVSKCTHSLTYLQAILYVNLNLGHRFPFFQREIGVVNCIIEKWFFVLMLQVWWKSLREKIKAFRRYWISAVNSGRNVTGLWFTLVDSNDKLYGSGEKFHEEVLKIIEPLVKDIYEELKKTESKVCNFLTILHLNRKKYEKTFVRNLLILPFSNLFDQNPVN